MTRSTTLDLALLTSLVAILVYASVDAWLGSSGADKIGPLHGEISTLEREIDTLERDRAALAAKTARLGGAEGAPVDAELLDERLRAVMGVARRDDVLLLPAETTRRAPE